MANAFENELSASAKHLGILYQKLSVPTRHGEVDGRAFSVKLAENPYDSFAVHQGRHVALELKSLKEHGSFPLVNLKPHQVDGLNDVLQAGGSAFLLVNMRRKKEKPDNRAWYLTFDYWDELLTLLDARNRKSVPYDFFVEEVLFQELPRRRVTNDLGDEQLVWDLRLPLGIEIAAPKVQPAAADEVPYDPENPWALPV